MQDGKSSNVNFEKQSSGDYYQVWNQSLFDLVPVTAKNILEIGCASGRLGEAIKTRNGQINYVGIEIVPSAGELAKLKLDQVFVDNIEYFDWKKLDSKFFDCIIFGDVLEHLIDPKKTLQAAIKNLTTDGDVITCLPNIGHWSIINGLLHGTWDYADSGLLDRTHLRFFTIKTFKDLLNECGLNVVQEAQLRNGDAIPGEIIPVLQKLRIDVNTFLDQVQTFQFLFRSKKNVSNISNPEELTSTGTFISQSVSIIIPVFNKVELTKNCLESIDRHYSKTLVPDVLVFDNASSDGTAEFLKMAQSQYEWLRVVRSEKNLGFARACNEGAKLSETEIVVFLNNDTIVLPNWLERMHEVINHKNVGMVGSKLIYPDGSIQHAGMVLNAEAVPTHIHHLAKLDSPEVNQIKEYPAVTGACIMIKRDLFLEVGCMDTEYPMYYEDVDLCFKIRSRGLKVLYQPKSVVIHLEGRSSANLDDILQHNKVSRIIFFNKWKDFILKDLKTDPQFYADGKEYVTF